VSRKFYHIFVTTVLPHFEGEKGEKGENPLYFRKVMHCMHLECDLNVIVWGEYDSHKCDTPKEKE
jgi:hypothetical protein